MTADASNADVSASRGVLELITATPAEPTAGDGVLRDLAVPAVVIDPGTPASEVHDLFRLNETLRWVVMATPTGPVLVERAWFESEMTGRLGYGRLLHARQRIDRMRHEPSLVLSADTPTGIAAASVLERKDPGAVFDGVVVVEDDRVAVASVTAIFERLARHYAHQSLHDTLTGLPNRLFLMERLRHRRGQHTVLLYVDLDRFKDVNDQFGQAAGDQVLGQFADRLRSVSRADDLVSRLGGDEFAVLTSSMSEPHSAALAERLVFEASMPFVVTVVDTEGLPREQLVSIGASVGVARSDRQPAALEHTSHDALLKQADLAMCRAKTRGRGRVAHFEPQMTESLEPSEQVAVRRSMERRLRAAIAEDGLHLRFQPIVDLSTGVMVGVEALARWVDDELGTVPPDQFIPLAEATGLIVDLGRWVLDQSCRHAASWAGQHGELPSISVNVSPVQVREPSFVDDVRAALDRHRLPARRLCLEITETAVVTDVDAAAERLRQLRQLGVRVALDDFGTGHSSLTLLRNLPLDVVKIDRSLIQRVATEAHDAVLVQLVVEASHSLGLRVCAEGIEQLAQAQQLVAMGCDTGQGWLFGKPSLPPGPSRSWSQLVPTRQPVSPVLEPPVALTGSDDLVVMTDRHRVVTYVSASVRRILGRTPSDVVGAPLPELLGAGHGEGRVTLRLSHQDGEVRWLRGTVQTLRDDSGDVRETLCVLSDETTAVMQEQALADSEELFRRAFDGAPIGIALSDLDGDLVRVNPALAALVGRTVDELLTMSVADITHPDDLRTDEHNLAEARAGTVRHHTVRKRYLHRDGHAVPVEVHAAMVHATGGVPSCVVAHVLPVAP